MPDIGIPAYPVDTDGQLQFRPAPPGATVLDTGHNLVLGLAGWWHGASGTRLFAAVLRPSILEASRVREL